MGWSKSNKNILKRTRNNPKISQGGIPELLDDSATKEKYFGLFIIIALFAFGVYHSVLYFGHQVMPNPDFTAFVQVGHELLSFQLPTSYKRVPVVGLLQAGLSYLVAGPHPDLTAGWLLNAILHPFNIVLLWLVCKRIIGRAAPWVAIIAIINPWMIALLRCPIAETTLLFFVLLTFYFIFRRSSWCYLFASITTMVRYEGAALILAAFVMDMIYHKGKRERLRAFLFSAIATLPLVFWMLGTFARWDSLGHGHYLVFIKETGPIAGGEIAWREFIELIWRMGFYPLFVPAPGASEETVKMLMNLSKTLVAVSFVFGVVYGLLKRRWNILALLIFLLPYFFIHAVHAVVIPRYCMPIHWIVLLICLYGLQSGWKLINKEGRVPKAIVVVLQGILLVLAFTWLVMLVPYLARIAPVSRRSVSIPYVACAIVVAALAARSFIYKGRYIWRGLVVATLVCLMIVSNQLMLVQVVGNGQGDIEFKHLADWWIANMRPDEKLLTTMSNVVMIFAPERKESLIHTGRIGAENPSDFVRKCYDKDITYVTWDSRIGFVVGDFYYKLWGIKNIAMLDRPRSIGPYEFVTQIPGSRRRFINIFRLRKPGDISVPQQE